MSKFSGRGLGRDTSRHVQRLMLGAAAVCLLAWGGVAQAQSGRNVGWDYNGGPHADHYSPLIQITRENAGQLKQVWKFDIEAGGLESQPIVVGRTIYLVTPNQRLVALDAANGAVKWSFEPNVPGAQPVRGLTSWTDGHVVRILFSDQNLIFMIDPDTGKPVPSFGDNGHIDVRENLRGKPEDNAIYLTSPAMTYRDLIIVGGGRVAETKPAAPGDARAYNVHTGKLVWTFHTIPHPGEVGADSWPKDAYLTQGGANAWSGTTIDTERGIVYINTGSPADDFYGVERLGNNRFANSTIALDAKTGKRLWDFQQVHHDLWDSDSTSEPILTTLNRDGKKIDAVIVTNKQSYIYTFDRVTGKPIFPIEEKPFPASTIPGEIASPTQPIPTLPHPLSRTHITVDDLTTRTPQANAWARGVFSKLNGAGGSYVPLALNKDTLVVPGFAGGNEWAGMAADQNGVIYANVANGASITSMVDFSSMHTQGVGETAYATQCSGCHGQSRAGNPPEFPSLIDVGKRLTPDQVAATIKTGRGRMPPFTSMSDSTVANLVSFLTTGADLPGVEPPPIRPPGVGNGLGTTKYVFTGYRGFTDLDGQSAVTPPLATLNAVDMNTGAYLWTVPFSNGFGRGGPTVTASGVLFIANGSNLQALDTKTAKVLWEGALPGNGNTPAVYMVDGKEYVVLAAAPRGGNGTTRAGAATPASGAYVAFALAD